MDWFLVLLKFHSVITSCSICFTSWNISWSPAVALVDLLALAFVFLFLINVSSLLFSKVNTWIFPGLVLCFIILVLLLMLLLIFSCWWSLSNQSHRWSYRFLVQVVQLFYPLSLVFFLFLHVGHMIGDGWMRALCFCIAYPSLLMIKKKCQLRVMFLSTQMPKLWWLLFGVPSSVPQLSPSTMSTFYKFCCLISFYSGIKAKWPCSCQEIT